MVTHSKNKAKRRVKKVDGIEYPYRDAMLIEEIKTVISQSFCNKGIRGDRFRCPIALCCLERIGCKWVEITQSTADLMLPDDNGEDEIIRYVLSDFSRKKQKEFDEDDKRVPFIVYLVAPYGSRTLDAQEAARNRKPTGGTVAITGSRKKPSKKFWPRFRELRTPRKARVAQERKQRLG